MRWREPGIAATLPFPSLPDMSDEEKPLEFSARDLMPDWAQEKPGDSQKDLAKRFGADDDRRERRGGGGGGRRDDRREGGRRDDRRGGPGGRGDRREGGDRGARFDRDRGDRPRGDRREGDRRGEGPRGDRRSGPPREGRFRGEGNRNEGSRNEGFHQDRPAEGITAAIEPSGPAIEGLTRHIRETFRSFPLADLAKLILEARERYRIRFTAAEPSRLFQCLADGSLWLSREEAISHLLGSSTLEHYYVAEDVEVEAPSGNFAVIAVCGMSGVILGPPNHHEYQRNIARLHRERFSDMSLERFKSRIRMESGEEILAKWREQVSRVRQYRLKPADAPSPVPASPEAKAEVEETPAEDAPEMTSGEAVSEDTPSTEEGAGDGSTGGGEPSPEMEAEAEAGDNAPEAELEAEATTAEPVPVETGPVFRSIEEVARHFRENFAQEAVVETRVAVVPGNVPGRLLSPGLLAHLRQETDRLRRGFPLALIQSLCQEFERKGLKFFKRGKKSLHVAAIRPKALDENVLLTDAIRAIVDFVKAAPKPTVAGLLEVLVPGFKNPEGPAIEESPEWSDAARAVLKDLRWLTAEGYILEFPDTGLAIGRQAQESPAAAPAPVQPAGKEKKKKKKEKAAPSQTSGTAPAAAASAESTGDPALEEEDDLPVFASDGDEIDPDDPYELPESVDPVKTF